MMPAFETAAYNNAVTTLLLLLLLLFILCVAPPYYQNRTILVTILPKLPHTYIVIYGALWASPMGQGRDPMQQRGIGHLLTEAGKEGSE